MTYPKTNKNGFSGEESSGVAYFFALAVFGLMVGGLSIGPDMERCKHLRGEDTFKCYEYLISAVPGFLIAINVCGLLSLVFLELSLHTFRQREAIRNHEDVRIGRPLPYCSRTRKIGLMLFLLGVLISFSIPLPPVSNEGMLMRKLSRGRSVVADGPLSRNLRQGQRGDARSLNVPLTSPRGRKLSGPQVRARESNIVPGVKFTPLVQFDGTWYPICRYGFVQNSSGATKVCQKLGYNIGVPTWDDEDSDPMAMPIGECGNGQDLDKCEFQGVNQWGKVNDSLCYFPNEEGSNIARVTCAQSLGDSCGESRFITNCADHDICCSFCPEYHSPMIHDACSEHDYFYNRTNCLTGTDRCLPCSLALNASTAGNICEEHFEKCRSVCESEDENDEGQSCLFSLIFFKGACSGPINKSSIRWMAFFAGLAHYMGFVVIFNDLGRWRALFDPSRSQIISRRMDNGEEEQGIYTEAERDCAWVYEKYALFVSTMVLPALAFTLIGLWGSAVEHLHSLEGMVIAIIVFVLNSLACLESSLYVIRNKGSFCSRKRLIGFSLIVIGLIGFIFVDLFINDLSMVVMQGPRKLKMIRSTSANFVSTLTNKDHKVIQTIKEKSKPQTPARSRKLSGGNGPLVRGRDIYSVKPGKEFLPEVLFNSSWYPICPHGFKDNWYGATQICKKLGFDVGVAEDKYEHQDDGPMGMLIGKCEDGQDLDKCKFQGINRWGETDGTLCSNDNFAYVTCFSELRDACKKDYYLSDCGESGKCCKECPDSYFCGETSFYDRDKCVGDSEPSDACAPCPLVDNAEFTKDHSGEHDPCRQQCKKGFNFWQQDPVSLAEIHDGRTEPIVCTEENIVADESVVCALIGIALLANTVGFFLIWKSIAPWKKFMLSWMVKAKIPEVSPAMEKVEKERSSIELAVVDKSSENPFVSALKQLKEAKDAGLLSEAEFQSAKEQMLSKFTGKSSSVSNPKIFPSQRVHEPAFLPNTQSGVASTPAPPPNIQNLVDKPSAGPITMNFTVPSHGNQTAVQNSIIENARNVGK